MKPQLYASAKDSFDASKPHNLPFSWGGNQSVQNRVQIWDNSNLQMVYDVTQTTQRLSHTIAENSLINGVTYTISVIVIESDGTQSEASDTAVFTCYSTPTFGLSLPAGHIIENSTYDIRANYTQNEGELLQEFIVYLYNALGNQIWTSGAIYDISETITLTELEDSHQYTIKATGYTVHGMMIETSLIPFTASYNKNNGNFVMCYLSNVPDDGAVKAQSNIIVLDGKCTITPVFTRDDTCLDVRNGKVYYDTDLLFGEDWHLSVKFYITAAAVNKKIVNLCDKNGFDAAIYLRARYQNNILRYYFETIILSEMYTHCYQSDYIDSFEKCWTIWLTKSGTMFNLKYF